MKWARQPRNALARAFLGCRASRKHGHRRALRALNLKPTASRRLVTDSGSCALRHRDYGPRALVRAPVRLTFLQRGGRAPLLVAFAGADPRLSSCRSSACRSSRIHNESSPASSLVAVSVMRARGGSPVPNCPARCASRSSRNRSSSIRWRSSRRFSMTAVVSSPETSSQRPAAHMLASSAACSKGRSSRRRPMSSRSRSASASE